MGDAARLIAALGRAAGGARTIYGAGKAAHAWWKSGGGPAGSASMIGRRGGSAASAYKRKGYGGRAGSSRVGRRTKYFKSAPRTELKYVDTDSAGEQDLASGGTTKGMAYILNPIAQGSGAQSRDGRQAVMRSIQVRLKFRRSATNVNSTVRIMIIFLRDQGVDLAAAGGAQFLLDKVSGAANDGYSINSHLNLSNTPNFTILKDVVIELDSGHGEEFYWQYYHKCRLTTNWLKGATGSLYSDFSKGALWLFLLDSNYSVANTMPRFSYASRVRFTDE